MPTATLASAQQALLQFLDLLEHKLGMLSYSHVCSPKDSETCCNRSVHDRLTWFWDNVRVVRVSCLRPERDGLHYDPGEIARSVLFVAGHRYLRNVA